jgi:hypothetical protein
MTCGGAKLTGSLRRAPGVDGAHLDRARAEVVDVEAPRQLRSTVCISRSSMRT